MEKDLCDFILTHALEEVLWDEVAAIEAESALPPAPSKALLGFIKGCVRKRKRALFLHHTPVYARRAAAFLLVAFATFSAVLLSTPPVQAAVGQVLMVHRTPKYAIFEYQEPADPELRANMQWDITAIPPGFELVLADRTSIVKQVEYQNPQGGDILFSYTDIPNYSRGIDTERHRYESYDLNGLAISLMIRTDTTSHNIAFWQCGSFNFDILTTLPVKDLKDLVASVHTNWEAEK